MAHEMETIRKALEEALKMCPCSLRERESGHRVDCYAPSAKDALSALAALQEERERMQADSRRLDATIERGWYVLESTTTEGAPLFGVFDGDGPGFNPIGEGASGRAAIDAAIGEPAASQGKE